jgi:hypothetical protein
MLRCITKCATCVTLNRNTAPFVRLCPAHPHNPARAAVGGERAGRVSPSASGTRGALPGLALERGESSARPSVCTESATLPRCAGHFVTARAEQSAHGDWKISALPELHRVASAPCGRPCESMFRLARAERASAPSNFARAFGMQFATSHSGARFSISFGVSGSNARTPAARVDDAGGLAKH